MALSSIYPQGTGNLSHRDIEDLLAECGIEVSYEVIRLWCNKFGSQYTKRLKRRHQGFGDTFYIGKFFVKIQSKESIAELCRREGTAQYDKGCLSARQSAGIHHLASDLAKRVFSAFNSVWL